MANAEQLLNRAQYAFQNIGYGNNPGSRKHTARARSNSMKVIRKYPGSSEAAIAHTILVRLDEDAYAAPSKFKHTHSTAPKNIHSHTDLRMPVPVQVSSRRSGNMSSEQLQWLKLIVRFFTLPKIVLGVFFLVGLFVFALFGPFILLPIAFLLILGSPLRQMFPEKNRQGADEVIRKINAWLDEGDGRWKMS